VSSTCFEHPSVHPQEDLYIKFYGISCIHISSLVDDTPECTSLPEDEHLDVEDLLHEIESFLRS